MSVCSDGRRRCASARGSKHTSALTQATTPAPQSTPANNPHLSTPSQPPAVSNRGHPAPASRLQTGHPASEKRPNSRRRGPRISSRRPHR